MFDGYWRDAVERAVDPIGVRLHRVGITANGLTTAGVAIAAATAVVTALGELRLALLCLAVAGVADLLDGPVAKATGPPTRRGAFFDSTADRVTDTLLLGGVAWYFVSDDRGDVIMLPVAVMAVSWLISYQRAKAESLSFDAKGGIMERAERIIALAVGFAFPDILVPILWLMLVLTSVTAVQRFIKVWRQGTEAIQVPGPDSA